MSFARQASRALTRAPVAPRPSSWGGWHSDFTARAREAQVHVIPAAVRTVTTPSKYPPRAEQEYPQGPPTITAHEAPGITPQTVDAYLESKLAHPQYAGEASVQSAVQRSRDAGLPEIAVSPMQGQFLGVLVRAMKARRVLEIGTLGGYSTAFLSKALPPEGQIDTIELSPEHARIAKQNFLEADLFPFPAVHVGPALDILRDPQGPFASANLPGSQEGEKDPGYDVCFVDADKEKVMEYWMECLRVTRRGGVIVLDNAVRGGRIASDDKDDNPGCAGFRKVYDWVKEDDGRTVLMSVIQTVGAKAWDGFAIAYKQ